MPRYLQDETVVKETTAPCKRLSVNGYKRSVIVRLCACENEPDHCVRVLAVRHLREEDDRWPYWWTHDVPKVDAELAYAVAVNDPDESYDRVMRHFADCDDASGGP
jgi:hypothetical protein